VIVLQFMGFMAGWNQPGALDPAVAAVIAALLASWATFLPSFVFIFLGAPYVERITRAPRISAALAAITAAVVGIIATLALLLARVVLLPDGWQGGIGIGWAALAIAAAVWWVLERTKLELHWALVAAALAGLAVQGLGWA
jgi:chromate transporter